MQKGCLNSKTLSFIYCVGLFIHSFAIVFIQNYHFCTSLCQPRSLTFGFIVVNSDWMTNFTLLTCSVNIDETSAQSATHLTAVMV